MTSPAKLPKWRRLAIPALCIMVTICLFPVAGFSKTYTLNPIADATVFVGSEFNWGTQPDLTVKNNVYSYLKFDLSTIPATEKITNATFNAFCSQALPAFDFAIQLRAVADTKWTEAGINGGAGNYPALGPIIDTYEQGSQGIYNQWTVGAAYLPRGLVSYALTLSSGSIAVYNSRENSSNKPYLQITTAESTAAPRYFYRSLGTLPGGNYSDPWSINNSGYMVGTSGNSSTFGRAFLKTVSQAMVDLSTLGGDASAGYDINDAGQIVGEAQDGEGEWRAFLKKPGELMVDLGLGIGSYATAINASGEITGGAWTNDGFLRAFLKTLDQPGISDLGTLGGNESYGNEINAFGHVVGQAKNSQGFGRAFLKIPGQDMEDLGTLEGNESEAMHINISGQVVGGAQNSAGSWRAFLKNPGQTALLDLGTLGGSQSGAVGFNNAGQIVGSADVDASTAHAFLWDNGFMYDLNHVTVNLPPGVTLLTAHAINDRGWIVGQDNHSTAFLLIPQKSISGLLQLLLLD
jgi:probable HAF family extracellular repeat protein